MQFDVLKDDAETDVGSYFVSNYPPFSTWSSEYVPAAFDALDRPHPDGASAPVGLYLHIPFCRKRCEFCYFRVYTDKNARDVDTYIDALSTEVALYAERRSLADRTFEFVYFGGGTPSFLSSDQLKRLVERINKHWTWSDAREVTFECEPGTLQESKLRAIRDVGVTRVSIGVEHFDDAILELNGRAHKAPEIFKAYQWARDVGFPQVNIDLIAGMVGDTDDGWKKAIDQALELAPDCLTIYQMEVPHNSMIARITKASGDPPPVADWRTKRAWVDYAFRAFEKEGYVVSSAYTLVKPSDHSDFVYRDAIWHGADMIGTGVASFSHVDGVHYQNAGDWSGYIETLERGQLPVHRALCMTPKQRLIRELILQLKLGRINAAYFRDKFDAEIHTEFAEAFRRIVADGFAEIDGDDIHLTRAGLLRVDAMLPYFFEPEFRDVRYS